MHFSAIGFCQSNYLRRKYSISEMIKLQSIDVTIGKYIVKFLPLNIISPGNFPMKGILSQKVIITPAATITIPKVINILPSDWNSLITEKFF